MSQNTSQAVMQKRHSSIDALDYFPTPPWATRAFMKECLMPWLGKTWLYTTHEPAAGAGHMAYVLAEFSKFVIASDVHDYGAGFEVGSYIGQGPDVLPAREPDWVITNPPFNLAEQFLDRALDDARHGVALLLRTSWLEGGDRYNSVFKPRPPSLVAQYCERVSMVSGRWDPGASLATSYAWFVWAKNYSGPTELRWIAPGSKARFTLPADLARWAT